jgi:hypothetical protein
MAERLLEQRAGVGPQLRAGKDVKWKTLLPNKRAKVSNPSGVTGSRRLWLILTLKI